MILVLVKGANPGFECVCMCGWTNELQRKNKARLLQLLTPSVLRGSVTLSHRLHQIQSFLFCIQHSSLLVIHQSADSLSLQTYHCHWLHFSQTKDSGHFVFSELCLLKMYHNWKYGFLAAFQLYLVYGRRYKQRSLNFPAISVFYAVCDEMTHDVTQAFVYLLSTLALNRDLGEYLNEVSSANSSGWISIQPHDTASLVQLCPTVHLSAPHLFSCHTPCRVPFLIYVYRLPRTSPSPLLYEYSTFWLVWIHT